jgi:malate dehydrogenase
MTGEYGIEDVYLGVIANVGAGGVQSIVQHPLTEEEAAGLAEAAIAVKEKVADLGALEL